MRMAGAKLKELSEKFGISGARAAQIFKREAARRANGR
jgi:hypothetical protein